MLVPSDLLLRPIQKNDRLNSLSLGDASHTPLKSFLRKKALEFHLSDFAKTYVLVPLADPPRVWGYMTLMNSEVVLEKNQKPSNLNDVYKVFPAVKIARLAVDKALQGKGYGRKMLAWSISLLREQIVPHVGCRYLTVDSKKESIGFYEKLGFSVLKPSSYDEETYLPMFFDIHKTE